MKKIIESEILALDTTEVSEICRGDRDRRRFVQATNEPYRMLVYLANQYTNGLHYDVGTRRGASAVALSCKPDSRVITWDIDSSYRERGGYAWPNVPSRPNIEFRVKNIFEEPASIYDDADIINFDVDPHDGIQERKFLKILNETKFSGILILDDINHSYFPEMKKMWEEIEMPKHIIPYAHGSGTGIISYGEELYIA